MLVFLAAIFAISIKTVSPSGADDHNNAALADFSSTCPSGYSQPANSNWTNCYKIFSNFKTKKSASSQCKANNGTLASVPNSFVNSYLYYLASQNGATSFWLGIECFNGDVNTCQNNGTPLVYTNFYPGQPNVDGTCVYMSSIGRDSQQWLSFDCEQKFQFACEVAAGGVEMVTTTTPAATTTTIKNNMQCPTGYSLFQGMCYMNAYSDGLTREQESTFCRRAPRGFLATIPNQDVDNFVQTLTCRNPYVRIGLTCSNVTFAGDTSSCVWDDGTPFAYSKFDNNYPEVNAGYNQCAYAYNGMWYNQASNGCNNNFACSLCQAPPQ